MLRLITTCFSFEDFFYRIDENDNQTQNKLSYNELTTIHIDIEDDDLLEIYNDSNSSNLSTQPNLSYTSDYSYQAKPPLRSLSSTNLDTITPLESSVNTFETSISIDNLTLCGIRDSLEIYKKSPNLEFNIIDDYSYINQKMCIK
jgi:hypothetical protein